MKERGKGTAGWCVPGATPPPPPLLLLLLLPLPLQPLQPLPPPLVQADGTKSIMYKDVKRNGSEMPDGVRMNGEDGGGVAGGLERKRNNRRAGRWNKDNKKEVGVEAEMHGATRKGRRLRSTAEANPARVVPAPYNVQSSTALADTTRRYTNDGMSVRSSILIDI